MAVSPFLSVSKRSLTPLAPAAKVEWTENQTGLKSVRGSAPLLWDLSALKPRSNMNLKGISIVFVCILLTRKNYKMFLYGTRRTVVVLAF